MYGKDLHEFCVSQGFAPRLLAFEELPGGWLGVTNGISLVGVRRRRVAIPFFVFVFVFLNPLLCA
jgi:hypothetical protein